MAHSHFEQLKKLLLLLDDPRNDIFVHVDKKSRNLDLDLFVDVTQQSSLTFIPRKKVTWGAYSQIRCELDLLETATKSFHDYYHLLSGVDLPIKSQDQIHSFFEINKGYEFLEFQDGAMEKKVFLDRIQVYHFLQDFVGNRKSNTRIFNIERVLLKLQQVLNIDRLKNSDLKFKKGANWFSITDDFAKYTISQIPQIRRLYKYTKCADEIFMHTLAWNSRFKESIITDSKRYIDWKRGNPYNFRLEDFDSIMNSPCFWARKFSEDDDPEIIQKIFDTFNVVR